MGGYNKNMLLSKLLIFNSLKHLIDAQYFDTINDIQGEQAGNRNIGQIEKYFVQ